MPCARREENQKLLTNKSNDYTQFFFLLPWRPLSIWALVFLFCPRKSMAKTEETFREGEKKKKNHYVKGFLHTVYLKDGWQGCRLLQSRPPWQRVWNQSVGRNVLCVIASILCSKRIGDFSEPAEYSRGWRGGVAWLLHNPRELEG